MPQTSSLVLTCHFLLTLSPLEKNPNGGKQDEKGRKKGRSGSGDKRKHPPTPPSKDFGDSELSDERTPPPTPHHRSFAHTTSWGYEQWRGPTSRASSGPALMTRMIPRRRRTRMGTMVVTRAAKTTRSVEAVAARAAATKTTTTKGLARIAVARAATAAVARAVV